MHVNKAPESAWLKADGPSSRSHYSHVALGPPETLADTLTDLRSPTSVDQRTSSRSGRLCPHHNRFRSSQVRFVFCFSWYLTVVCRPVIRFMVPIWLTIYLVIECCKTTSRHVRAGDVGQSTRAWFACRAYVVWWHRYAIHTPTRTNWALSLSVCGSPPLFGCIYVYVCVLIKSRG